MSQPANNLKQLRKSFPMSQEALSEISGVSKKTIGRFERGKTSPNPKTIERIAKALNVKPSQLLEAPGRQEDADSRLRRMGYRPLRTYLDDETALAFQMVEHVYGIPVRGQILMAPLFCALLAEGSLSSRKEKLAEINDAALNLQFLARGHLSFANDVAGVIEGTYDEMRSIEKKDVFGREFTEEWPHEKFDPDEHNPFADYLEDFIKEIEAKDISLTDRHGDPAWKTEEGLPNYTISSDVFDALTGGNSWAEFALVRGFTRIRDIPEDLMGEDATEARIEWLESKIPADERARREEWLASLAEINIDDI